MRAGGGVDIAFQSRSLRDLCENEALLSERFGLAVAAQIAARLADLRAAGSMQDLVLSGLCTPAAGAQVTADVGKGLRMSLIANHLQRRDGAIAAPDWSQVTRIKVVTIGKTP